MRAAVDDGRINDLPSSGGTSMHDSGEQTYREIHGAAADIANQCGRRQWGLARLPGVPKGTGKREIIEVMTGGMCKGAMLSPPCHAPVDESWITLQANVWPEAEPLHHAGTHAFNQGVAMRNQRQQGVDAVWRFEIDRY